MENRLTTKQRVGRIPLDYHKRPDAIRARRNVLTIVAALGTVFAVVGMAVSSHWRAAASPGPLSKAHAQWEQQCSVCHTDFTPIRSDTWLEARAGPAAGASLDQKCSTCHVTAAHHASTVESTRCSDCHHEHQGSQRLLSEVGDAACTKCHADLALHGHGDFSPRVTSFPTDHPDFRSLKSDAGTLKFNHRLHLSPGLVEPGTRRPEWTLADIDPEFREQYRRFGKTGQLECADCHSAALATDHAAKSRPLADVARWASGEHMLPVTYSAHCRGCHPLNYQGDAPALPHGTSLLEIREVLTGRFWEEKLEAQPELGEQARLSRPLPGRFQTQAWKEAEAVVRRRVEHVESHCRNVTCGVCHEIPANGSEEFPEIAPVNLVANWFRHAEFDHAPHRHMSCRECHEAAYPDSPRASTRADDVMIAGVAKCRECHTPRTSSSERGGADFRCIECHRYHPAHSASGGPRP